MKLILVHVPKTAGSAIILTYKNEIQYWGHNTRDRSFERFPDFLQKEEKTRSVLAQFIKSFNRKKSYYSMAVIRNTWERIYSGYNYLSKGGLESEDHKDFEIYIKPYKDFNDFVRYGLEKAFNEQIHFKSQLFWIADDNLKIKVDFILKFEDVNEQMKKLMLKFNLQPKDLLVYNQYNSSDFREVYSRDSIKKVSEIYYDEIKKFDFQYG